VVSACHLSSGTLRQGPAPTRLAIALAIAAAVVPLSVQAQAVDAASTPAQSSGQADPSADGGAVDLGAVTVTARKRDERNLDVPIAVTAITGEQIDAMGIDNVGDAISFSPGAAAYDAGGAFTYIQIRGASARQGSNENGYYLDEVPFNGVTVPWYPETRSFDIERIEILKGPQGTLFGEGSMGGTVRVITRKPEFNAFRAGVETSFSDTRGGTDGWGVKAMVNVPLVDDTLAMRFGVTDESLSGWLRNRQTGEENINEQRIRTGRAKLRFAPHERFNLDLSYWKFKAHSPGGFEAAYDDMSVDAYYDVRNEWDSGSLTASYAFDDSQLLYVFSDGSLWRGLSGMINPTTAYAGTVDIGVRTHELRWSSTGERVVDWTMGYYLRKAIRRDSSAMTGLSPTRSSQTNDSFSLFGEATWHIGEKWAATAGVRYFEDKVDSMDASETTRNTLRKTFTNTSPRLSLSYAIDADSTLYASAASGYRSGQLQPITSIELAERYGIDLPVGTKPDSIWSYELGYKAVFDEGRLLLETAVFHSDWKDVPVYMSLADGLYSGILNSAGSTQRGVELGITWMPNKSWAFNFGGSVIDAVYKEDLEGTQFHKGTPVFNVPRTTLSGGAAYHWPVGDSLKGIARSDVMYHSRRETSATAGTEGGDAITRLSARVGLESPSGWAAYLFGENLTNEDGATDARSMTGAATRLRPRTFGVEFRYSY